MNAQIRRWTAFVALAVFVAFGATADTLYLRNGEEAEGTLKTITQDEVVFQTRDGIKTLKKKDVTKVQLQQARKFDDVQKVNQITDPDLKACVASAPKAQDYPNDGAVVLLRRITYDCREPGVVKETVRTISKVLRQRGEDIGSTDIMYFEDTDTPHIDFALTITSDGRVLHVNDSAVKNESIYSRLPDYRRLARYRFACKEPLPGNILDVQYTVTRKRNTNLEPFFAENTYRGNSPILRMEVQALIPGDGSAKDSWKQSVTAALTGQGLSNVKFTERPLQASSGGTVLLWQLTKPEPGIRTEPLMPPTTEFSPTLTVAKPETWENEVTAYAKALDSVPGLSDDLKSKAIQLAKDDGARAIYNYIARTIRTVPVPWPAYRITPHSPEETAQRGLGNELDKNFLYLKMLQAAGIEARFALVRDRDRGPLAKDVPSLYAFDRSAVYLEKERKYSTTSSDVLPFETLPSSLQATPALMIETGTKAPGLTNASTPDEELSSTHFDATLDADGALTLDVTYRGAANAAVGIRSLKNLDEESLRHWLQQLASGIHPGATLTAYDKTDLADLNVPPSITLHCKIPGYAVKAGDDLMLFNVPCVDYTASVVGRPTRDHDLFWSNVAFETCDGIVHLPAGYRIYAAPKSQSFDSADASYDVTLKSESKEIHYTDKYTLKVREAPRDTYPKYKKCNDLRASIARQSVILMRGDS